MIITAPGMLAQPLRNGAGNSISAMTKRRLKKEMEKRIMVDKFKTWTLRTLSVGLLVFGSSLARAGSVTISWDANKESDLAGYKVYFGTQSKNYTDFNDVGSVTSFKISNLEAGKTYFFAVTAYDNSGNESGFSAEVSANIPTQPAPNNPPELITVTPRGETQIDVIFSEPLDKASAETAANYSISGSIQVLGAILDGNQTTAHLITSAHQKDRTYTLSVSNVKDKDGLAVAAGSSKNYSIPGSQTPGDTAPPQMTYVGVVNTTELDVIFSEPVQKSSAETIANYSINNGVTVQQARLGATASIVKLTTSPHQPGATYTLTVNNIRDDAGNSVQPNSSLTYKLPEAGNPDNSPPQITSVMVKGATQIDVNFNEVLDKAAAENKSNFSINKNIQILGAVLDANNVTVHLLTSNHQNGDYTLTVNRVKDLAGNQIASNSRVNYKVENANDGSNGNNPDPITPNNFTLFQNYPNPFNPETEIRFYLEKDRKIELKIYNPLGQLVKTLVKDQLSEGFHTVVWDGTNNDGNQMPTGVYIYSLEVSREVLKGDLLVNVSLERRVKKMTLIR